MVNIPFIIQPIFVEAILPFVLVFTLIFAILQKTQLLGDGKKQIDALVGAVVGFILIAFPSAREIVVLLMPFLAVSAVVLLVFMILYGFIAGNKTGDVLGKYWKWALNTILAIAVVTALLMITGYWDFVYGFMFDSSLGYQIWVNVLLIGVIVAAIVAVLRGDSSG